jgi:cbb3-type cytochrome oxidase subunit 3
MDVNTLRVLVTLLSLGLFVGLTVWTWRASRLPAHELAARLPFDGEALDPDAGASR